MAKERLIVFTRYPEPGKTKTRLIPALGALGAATLQRQMTEYVLLQARELQNFHSVSIEVRFAGGEQQSMQEWLGKDFQYVAQGTGDLGCRMKKAIADACQNKIESVAIIGSDCPQLQAMAIAQAFQLLHQDCDLVLGPAIDGGYYLIGVNRLIPELFIGIDWGTDRVLQQTVNIAKKLNLAIAYLPTLADVDRPEDLYIWQNMISKQ